MSFALTEPQYLDGSKTVTRRTGWKTLKPGERVMGIRKGMGLKKGEQQVELGPFDALNVRLERLDAITADDVTREGFPGKSPAWFVEFFCRTHSCRPNTVVTRIEFKRVRPNERFAEIKAGAAEAQRTGINVYSHADVQWLIDRCESLEAGARQTALFRQLPLPQHLEDMLGRLWTWTTTYGEALCPRLRADSFGEGMREAKEQVSRMLVPYMQHPECSICRRRHGSEVQHACE